MLNIEVAYAGVSQTIIIPLSVMEGTTIHQAITQSAIQIECPEIDLSVQSVGIFGELKALSDLVEAGDRVEIYRSLKQSAIDARKRRAKEAKAARARLKMAKALAKQR